MSSHAFDSSPYRRIRPAGRADSGFEQDASDLAWVEGQLAAVHLEAPESAGTISSTTPTTVITTAANHKSRSHHDSTDKPIHSPPTSTEQRPSTADPSPTRRRRPSCASSKKSSSASSTSSSSRHRRRPSSHAQKQAQQSPTQAAAAARRPRPRRISSTPQPERDISSAIALHERSCQIFRAYSAANSVSTTTPQANAPASPPISVHGNFSVSSVQRLPSAEYERPDCTWALPAAPAATTNTTSALATKAEPLVAVEAATGDAAPATDPNSLNAVIHWTSPSTRRREYAAIDASHRGLRGLVRRLAPALCFGSSRQQFYDEKKKDTSDTCSVRRYRLDLPDDCRTAASSSYGFGRRNRMKRGLLCVDA